MNPSAEACCMIEAWDPKHLFKRGACKLIVKHILHGRSRTLLSLCTDLNSNAATCKVYARSCCHLRLTRAHAATPMYQPWAIMWF